jgi:hypothetical protein
MVNLLKEIELEKGQALERQIAKKSVVKLTFQE